MKLILKNKTLKIALLSLSILTSVTALAAVEKIGSFDIIMSPTQVFQKNGAALKPIQDQEDFVFNHENESYAVVAKRADGTVATVVRQPSDMNPGKYFYMGYFFNCEQKTDIPMIFEDEKELTDILKSAPSTFTAQIKQDQSAQNFDDSMGVHDLYLLSCQK